MVRSRQEILQEKEKETATQKTMKNAVLQTTQRVPFAALGQKVQDLVFKIWELNTDEYGTLAHTLRTMYRVPTRQVETMGYQMSARISTTRSELLHNLDVRRETLASRPKSQEIPLSAIHEAVKASCR